MIILSMEYGIPFWYNFSILFETGIGAFFSPKYKDRFGVTGTQNQLIQNLEQLGLSDKDIDVVVLSHLHFDHASLQVVRERHSSTTGQIVTGNQVPEAVRRVPSRITSLRLLQAFQQLHLLKTLPGKAAK